MRSLDEFAGEKLKSLEQAKLRRAPTVTARAGIWAERDGRRLLSFSCNDYLNLSQHPEVLADKSALVSAAGQELATLYNENVFPYMKVTWGTHPNHIGHQDYPGCFRCHDGDHTAKNGTAITQDCSACHNLLAVEEAKPKVLADLGIQ